MIARDPNLENDGSLVDRAFARGKTRDRSLDRSLARRRGVVHTPIEIARAVLRMTDEILMRELGCARGIASDDVVIVDPATGPGIFLAAALEQAGARGAPRACIGLDVDAAALDDARAVLTPHAHRSGWPLRLEHADALASAVPVPELSDDDAIRVVVGNPPWAARSANRAAEYTEGLLEDFRRGADGHRLRERRIGVLSDDYVRFFRWSAELVRQARRGGVLAFVTNASFLDGPVHRAMRGALARWMDRIDIVDLGGSGLVARSDAPDENVFRVRPSVAITLAVRYPGAEPRRGAVRIATLRGSKSEKFEALSHGALGYIDRPSHDPWVAPRGPSSSRYSTWPSLTEWMPFHREGLQTNRDDLVTASDRESLVAQLERFVHGSSPRSTEHWDPDQGRAIARELLSNAALFDAHTREIAYRPFESRIAVIHPALCHRPRPELMSAIDRSPLTLITTRKDRGRVEWRHVGAVRAIPDNCWLSTRSSCRARAFPIACPSGAPNLDARLARDTAMRLGREIDATSLAHWALAWLSSRAYREAERDALSSDYPRVPPPKDLDEWKTFTEHGAAIAGAFLDTHSTASHTEDSEVTPVALTLRVGHHEVLGRFRKAYPHSNSRAIEARVERLTQAIAHAEKELGPEVEARLHGDE